MPTISTYNYSLLENARRLDAEFYEPLLMRTISFLRSKPHTTLAKENIIRSGTTPPDRDDELKNGIVLLKTINIQNSVLSIKGDYYRISKEIDERLSKTRVCQKDVLINIVGATLDVIGRTSFVPEGFESANITQAMALLRSKPNSRITPEYLFSFLQTHYGLVQIYRTARPTGQYNLNLQELSGFVIPTLSSRFQNLIREFVSVSQDKQLKSSECYSQGKNLLLSELRLQGWNPTRVLSYARGYQQASRARRIDAEYFHPKHQEMLNNIPEYVHFDRLGKLTTHTKGFEVGSSAYIDSGIPFWRVSNLSEHGLNESNANFISQDLYESLRLNYEPKQGEILLSKDATLGLAHYLENPTKGIISSGILRLVIIDSIPPHYLELVLNSIFVQMQIEQDCGGSIIKHWKPSEVRKTLIPRLSNEKEREIASLVQRSHEERREAIACLEKAKRAVEIAIEENEEGAIEFIGEFDKREGKI